MTVAREAKVEQPVEVAAAAPAGDAPSIISDEVALGARAIPAGEPMPSVEADPAEHAVAMPSLLADGTPEHPAAVVLVDEDDPRAVHFEG